MSRKKWLYGLIPFVLIAGFISYVAYRTRHVPTPRRKWKRFNHPHAKFLQEETCRKLQGIYTIHRGKDFFGNLAVVKWTYTIEPQRKIHHLSFYCERNGIYIICEGKQYGNRIFLSGFWRKATANGTGAIHLSLHAHNIVFPSQHSFLHHLVIEGWYGHGDEEPLNPVSFFYKKSLPKLPAFDILGHRGGARNVDFLPVSENSLEMLKMAAPLGLNGVEIDVRLTKDGIPVVFHDSFLSIHTVKDKVYGGSLHNYTLQELKNIELRKGGFTPTLEEYLNTMLYQTPLEIAWLDIKSECDLTAIHHLQQQYLRKAKQTGRRLEIYIGIPDEKILGCFKQLPNYSNIPSLLELDPPIVIENNCSVWAMQYVKGIRKEDVAKIKAAGKKSYVWTLDSREIMDLYIKEGHYDGLVTNAPSVAAFWFYTHYTSHNQNTRQMKNGWLSSLENNYNKVMAMIRNAS